MKVFTFDYSRCNGCYNCQIACKDEHCENDWSPIAKPQPMTSHFWCKVSEHELGKVPWVRVVYNVRLCAHCGDAPCMAAGGDAVYRRDDGLVIIDPQKAKGMRELVDSCPIGAIYWNEVLGIPQKCTGCAHLLDDGWTVPRCVDQCATDALQYVEYDEVKYLLGDAQPPAELDGCSPRFFYLKMPKPRITGTVADRSINEVVIGANVLLRNDVGERIQAVLTDEFGDFRFADVEPGSYTVRIEADGYEALECAAVVDGNDCVLGDLLVKVSARTISEYENAMRILNHTGDAEWVPVSSDVFQTVIPSALRERPVGDETQDWFGCSWVWEPRNLGWAPDLHKPYLLDDIRNWREKVVFPDVEAIDWKAAAEKDLADIDRENRIVRIMVEAGPFERTHHLLGFEETFIAMATEPEEYFALISAITDYKVKLLGLLADAYKPEVFFLHDDLGSSQGPLMSLEMYRELVKPSHMRLGAVCKEHGVIYMHHSCGCNQLFLEDLYECGARLFHPLQYFNDRHAVANQFMGRDVAFEIGIDSVNYGGPAEIVAEVRDVIDAFGPGKNLFCGCFASDTGKQDQSVVAIDEVRSYGRFR